MLREVLFCLSTWAFAGQPATPDLGGHTPGGEVVWTSTAKKVGNGWEIEHFLHKRTPGTVKVVWYLLCDTWLSDSNAPVSLGVTKGGVISPQGVNGQIEVDKTPKKPASYYQFPVNVASFEATRLESVVQLTVQLGGRYQALHFRTLSEVVDDRIKYTIDLGEKELGASMRLKWTAWSDPKEAALMQFKNGSFEGGYFRLPEGVNHFTTPAASKYSVRPGRLIVFDRGEKELGAIVSPALRPAPKGAK